MLGEKRSGDIFGPGPKREIGGQAAMAEATGDDQEVELQKYSDSKRREIEYEDESAQRGESEAAVPEKQPVLEELSLEEISRTEEEDEERLLFQESQAPRAHNLFFSPQGECKFSCRMQSRPTSTPYRHLKLLTRSESS